MLDCLAPPGDQVGGLLKHSRGGKGPTACRDQKSNYRSEGRECGGLKASPSNKACLGFREIQNQNLCFQSVFRFELKKQSVLKVFDLDACFEMQMKAGSGFEKVFEGAFGGNQSGKNKSGGAPPSPKGGAELS